jgi:hypothetical protein
MSAEAASSGRVEAGTTPDHVSTAIKMMIGIGTPRKNNSIERMIASSASLESRR